MPKYAEFNGEILEFPDDTADDVIDGVVKKLATPKGGGLMDQVTDIASAGTAAVDLIGGSAGFAAGLGTGLLEAASGHKTMRRAVDKAGKWAEKTMPSTYIDELKGQRERPGYAALMRPIELLGKAIHGAGQGVQMGAEALGAPPQVASELGAGTEGAALLGLPFARGPKPAAGSARAYQQTYANKGGVTDLRGPPEAPDPMAAALNEAKIKQAQADATYQAGYEQLDNTMLHYPKDQGAPQYTQGSKMSKPPGTGRGMDAGMSRYDQGSIEADINLAGKQPLDPAATITSVDGMKSVETVGALDRPSKLELAPKEPDIPTISRHRQDAPPEVIEALAKPGFQRDATDLLSIREWEKQKLVEAGIAEYVPEVFRELPSLRVDSPSYNTHLFHDLVTFESRGARYGLETIKNTSQNPYYKLLAEKLLEDTTYNPRLKIVTEETIAIKNAWGTYDPSKYTINIRGRYLGDEQLFLHENIHARTHATIEMASKSPSAMDNYGLKRIPSRKAVQRLDKLYESFWKDIDATKLGDEGRLPYGMENLHEFIAEAFTNPEFQAMLASKQAPKGSIFRNFFDAFVDAVRELFGFDKRSNTYLEEVIKAGSEIMSKTSSQERRFFEGTDIKDVYGSFRDFKTKLEEQGTKIPDDVAKAIYAQHFGQEAATRPTTTNQAAVKQASKIPGLERLKEALNDERTPEQLAEDLKDPSLKDINRVKKNTLKKLQPKRYAAEEHTLTRWTSSKIDQIKDESMANADRVLVGEKWENGKRVPAPGSAMYLWDKLKDNQKTLIKDVMNDLTDMRVESTEANIQARAREVYGRELTRDELQSYHDRHNGMKTILKDVNQRLVEMGKPPIPEMLTFSIPAEWFGEYIYFIRDKNGEMVAPVGARFRPDSFMGKKFNRELNSRLKALGLDLNAKQYVRKDVNKDVDFLQIETMLRALGSKDPRTQAVRAAVGDIMKAMSYRRHGLHRKGYKGYRGSEPGTKGLREYEKLYEETVRKAYNFIANRKLDDTFAAISKMPETERFPNARNLSLEMIDGARGGMHKLFEEVDNTLRDTFDAMGLPPTLFHSTLKKSNQTMVQLLLGFWLPSQLGAQLTQHVFTVPKMMSMDPGFFKLATLRAMGKGYETLMKPDHADIKALAKEGAFEPSFRYDYLDYNYESTLSKMHKGAERGFGLTTLAWVEANVVRKPAALMFLNMLRETGYNKPDIYRMAKQLTDSYMVSNQRYEKAAFINRTGIVGDAIGPLQSFPTTWASQFLEYSALASKGKVSPLASFVLMNWITAGLMGLILVKEVDGLIMLYNSLFEKQVPTLTEKILAGEVSDMTKFGAISSATGMNYGATMNAPSLRGTGAPGIQLLVNMLNAAYIGTRTAIGGTHEPTTVEKREAIKGVTPRTFHGAIERTFTPEGMPYRDTANRGAAHARDKQDWKARYFGSYSLDETKAKHQTYEKRRIRENLDVQKRDFIRRTVDRIEEGGTIPPEYITRAIKDLEYTDNKELLEQLRREVFERYTTERQRDVRKGTSDKQKKLYMLYQRLGGY